MNIFNHLKTEFQPLEIDIYDTPSITDKGANIESALKLLLNIPCSCHCLTTVLSTTIEKIKEEFLNVDKKIAQLNKLFHPLSNLQEFRNKQSVKLKHGVITRPCRSYINIFKTALKYRR